MSTDVHAGLSDSEARLELRDHGPNELTRTDARRWPKELVDQFTQPLVLLLGLAAVLAWLGGTPALSLAVVAVIVLNGAFAFVQEMQAEHAVDSLAAYMPATCRVVRGGIGREIAARDLVPGDVLLIGEGDRISADGRIVDGAVTVDMSALTGESVPAARSATPEHGVVTGSRPSLHAQDAVFSGTTCVGGDAVVVVGNTGMETEIGRIATLSGGPHAATSPLEAQVKRATMIIALVAVGVGATFLPVGVAAGLGWAAALSFSIGLIVANVPEGLLPTITLALAAGVRDLARHGAVVKRLSAVETLGSVTVICTDKTGTLTQNRMTARAVWTPFGAFEPGDPEVRALAASAAACTTAELATPTQLTATGDLTEIGVLELAATAGVSISAEDRRRRQHLILPFDAHLKRMTTVVASSDGRVVHTNGAVESVLPLCTHSIREDGSLVELDDTGRTDAMDALDDFARRGLRVLAIARRVVVDQDASFDVRGEVERALALHGLIAFEDPPRDGVAHAVAEAHRAGIRIHVVTGDNGLTASEIARRVGIGSAGHRIVGGDELDRTTDDELAHMLASSDEIVFARVSPEVKLRITTSLQSTGDVVVMTGDGVNDAPALRHADIGVAMGRSGTDVARDAATVVLTDDDFATIVLAVGTGRRVFDNVRKFVLYIFAHAVPEVVPFLLFAVSGGAIPLPLTVLQILAVDLGTETLPALALGREPAEPGLMDRKPRPRSDAIIDRALLFRAWVLLGTVSAILVMTGFFVTLWSAGWRFGDPTGEGTDLHGAYLQATTMTFAGIVACQIGTAFAARTERASLFTVGVLSNRPLLWGVGFEVVFTACVIYLPPLQSIFGTAALEVYQLALLAPFPFVVWGVDEARRLMRRRSAQSRQRGTLCPVGPDALPQH